MEVTVRGPALQVELNGTRILDTDLSKVTHYMDNRFRMMNSHLHVPSKVNVSVENDS